MVRFDRLREASLGAGNGSIAACRRTGVDTTFGDPLQSRGAQMESWFWQITKVGSLPGP